MIEYGVPILIILALVLVNGLFVAAEFAIIGVRSTRLAQLVENGNRTAAAIKAIRDDARAQDRYIATAQIGITLASLGLGMYGEATVAHWVEAPLETYFHLGIEVAHSIAIVVALALMTFAHVVIGEMVPKSLALQYAEQTALGIAGIMVLMSRLFSPAVYVLNALGNALLGLFGIPATAGEHRLYSADELELVVAESAEGGLMTSQQERLIHNIFDFGERTVSQVMTPRTRISALPISIPDEDVTAQLAVATHSRLVVYERNLDNILGVVLVKDAIQRQLEQSGPLSIRALVRPMPIVPETARIGRVMSAFKRDRVHMALVIDEYGGTAGIVTMEDLVEEVVGEIHDEFDQDELPRLRPVEPGVIVVRGDVLLDELVELLDLELPEDAAAHVDTLGGLIITMLGRPPEVGDTVTLNGANIDVEATKGRAVQFARISQQSPPPEGEHPMHEQRQH